MLKLMKYLRKNEWLMICCSLIFIVAQVWLDLRLPDYMAEITTLIQSESDVMSDILLAGGLLNYTKKQNA